MHVCVVGSTMIDLVSRVPRLPVIGETLAGSSFATGYGGKGGNQAVTAARLGAHVTLLTRLGSDAFGDRAAGNYAACGVDCRYLVRDASLPTGVASIFVDDRAQNAIVIVPAANDALSAHDVEAARAAIEVARVVVAQLEIPIDTVTAAFRLARASGATTILNPAPARALPDELLALTDIVVPNETEAAALTGIAVADLDSAVRAGRALLERGPHTAIVTCGHRGSVAVDASGTTQIAPLTVAAVDPTGAGDAFVGTLAYGIAAGSSPASMVRCANAVAALSVTRSGTQPSFPTRAEADAFLATFDLALP